jgi:hypothetical protein
MLEHDPRWRESLAHNLQWLKRGGLLLLSWGAEGNLRHDPEPWAWVPVIDVKDWASSMKLTILEGFWSACAIETTALVATTWCSELAGESGFFFEEPSL